MKKIICLALALGLIATLAACGSAPAFDPLTPTEAQSFAIAAMESCPVKTGYELKDACVLLTGDFAGDMAGSVALEKWDLSGVAAAVVLTLGPAQPQQTENSETAADNTVFFLLDADKNIIFSHITGISTGTQEPQDSEDADYSQLLSELTDEYGDDEFSAPALRQKLARLELDEEDFIAALGEADAAAVAKAQAAIEADPGQLYDTDYLISVSKSKAMATFDEYERERLRLLGRISVLTGSEELSDEDKYSAYSRMTDSEFYDECRLALGEQLAAAQSALARCESANAQTLAPLKAEVDALAKKDEDYLYSEAYLALCAGSAALDTCDICRRKISLCSSAAELLEELAVSEDAETSIYLIERAAEGALGLTNYVSALKSAEVSALSCESFVAENRVALETYDEAIDALREELGEDLSESVEYIKLQMKYSEVIDERSTLESHAGDAEALAAAAYSNWQSNLEGIDKREQARRDGLAAVDEQAELIDYFETAPDSVSEFDAQPGQWARLAGDYLLWQNQNLRRPVTHAGNGSDKTGDDGDFNPSGDYYLAHDLDGNGKMSKKELRAALAEYINRLNEMFVIK